MTTLVILLLKYIEEQGKYFEEEVGKLKDQIARLKVSEDTKGNCPCCNKTSTPSLAL